MMHNQIFFNTINQSKPVFVLDIRSAFDFETVRFRGRTMRFDASQSLDEKSLMCYFQDVADKNSIMLILASGKSSDPNVISSILSVASHAISESKKHDEDNLMANIGWNKVLSVDLVDFDKFYENYKTCPSLFVGSKIPRFERNQVKEYPTEIVYGFLYLGSYYDATDEKILKDLGITHLVDATGEKLSENTAMKLGLAHFPVAIWDAEGVDIASHFNSVLEFIESARSSGGKILIHCRAGISRSSTFVMVYLMKHGIVDSLKAAVKLVIDERPYVLPNPSFREQLQRRQVLERYVRHRERLRQDSYRFCHEVESQRHNRRGRVPRGRYRRRICGVEAEETVSEERGRQSN